MRRRWFEPFGRVLHMSDPALFLKIARRLSVAMTLRHGWQCLACNAADLGDLPLPRFARVKARPVPSQFKSRDLQAGDIRPLYSLPLLIGYRLH